MKKLMMACVAACAAATGLGGTYQLDHGGLSDAEAGAALVEQVGACGQGDEIVLGKGRWLLGGTTVKLAKKEMKLTGATGDPRDVVIDGDGKSTCITVPNGADNVTISGLTASNGLVTVNSETDKRGGGIYSLGTNLLVTNCVVTCCQGSFDGSEKASAYNYIYGVGICSFGTGSQIVDSLVENNRAYLTQAIVTRDYNYGVGIYVSLGTVRKCVVRNNWFVQKVSSAGLITFAMWGLGIYTANATVDSCAIYGNDATNEVGNVQYPTIDTSLGGGVYLSNSADVLKNSRVTENRACQGAGVYMSGGNCRIENCDLVCNRGKGAMYSKGGNLYVAGSGCKVFGTRLDEGYATDASIAYVNGAGACISNCIVRGSTTSSPFFVMGDNLTNTHSLVCNNTVNYFYEKRGHGLTVTDCVFSNNVQSAAYCGFADMETTINNDAQVKRVRNCLFVGNTLAGGTGRGKMAGTAPVQFVWESCTFVSNAMANSLYRFSNDGLSKTRVAGEGPKLAPCLITRNCLFWKNYNGKNPATIITSDFAGSPNSVLNNFIYGADGAYVTTANGNIIDVEDPGFVDAANGDYRIARKSVVRDKGSLSDWMGDGSRKSPRDLGKGFDVEEGVVTFTAFGEAHTVGCNLTKISAGPRLYGDAPDIGCSEYFCPPGLMLLVR